MKFLLFEFMCLGSACLVMDATTNNTLLLSVKALHKAEIHNKGSGHQSWEKKPKAPTSEDELSNHWPTNSLIFPNFTTASFTCAHLLLSISCATVSNLTHTHRCQNRSQKYRGGFQNDQHHL